MRICQYLLFVALPFSSFATSEDVMLLREAVQKHLLVVVAKPRYPSDIEAEAGVRRRTYTGLFELKFDYDSGHLREVHVVKSTGNRAVDGRAIGSLKVWEAKPRSIHNLVVPVSFKPLGIF
jgi:hypothetical protein